LPEEADTLVQWNHDFRRGDVCASQAFVEEPNSKLRPSPPHLNLVVICC